MFLISRVKKQNKDLHSVMYKTEPRSARSEAQLSKRGGAWSRSSSRTRRPSLPRKKSSQRLIRAINLDGKADDPSSGNGDSSGNSLKIPFGEESNEYIEVPYVKAILDASLPTDYFKQDVLEVIQRIRIRKWCKQRKLEVNELKVTKIVGSMTNAIFKISYPKLPSLLLRVYGPNVSTLIDRNYELQILARLSAQNIGPSLYGCFENGRFEQFLENSRTLTKKDIRDWKTSQRIARRMKELHQCVPLVQWEKEHVMAWNRIDKWIVNIERSTWVRDPTNIQHTLLSASWDRFKETVNVYREWLRENAAFERPLVFCHNDTQYGNLLFTSPIISNNSALSGSVNDSPSVESQPDSLFPSESNISLDDIINPSVQEQSQDSKLVVIDFEYAGPNPIEFDLANHLSEWMSDYHCPESHKIMESNFPKREEILNFVYSYVSHLKTSKAAFIDEEVRTLYNGIIRWRACVALHWCLWALIQSGKLEDINEEAKVLEQEGPGGEKYIITLDEDSSENSEDSDKLFNNDEDASVTQGADIDSFDYLGYSREKIAFFYGDMIQLGIVKPSDVLDGIPLKKLDTTFL